MPVLDTVSAPKVNRDPNAKPEGKTHKKAKKGDLALKRSALNFRHASTQHRRSINLLWGKATGCPLWKQDRIRKKDKVTGEYSPWPLDKKGKPIKIRSNRVLSSTTLKTLASGAAGAVCKQLHEEARALRCDTSGEVEKFPMQPAFGVGASMEVEAAFVAYIQEIFRTAVDIKSAVGKHSKVSAKSMQAAADIVNRKIAATTGFMPPLVTSRHPLKRKRSSIKKGNAAGTKSEGVKANGKA